jgi:tetratricopeptide (TPR) repeat protein
VLSGITDPILSAAADELRVVVESGTDAAIKKTARDFARQLDGLSADSLHKAWRSLENCVDEEPGDERVVIRFAALGEKLRRRDAGVETDRAVKDALERLAELSPARFAPRKRLGDLLARQGHLTEAAAAFEKAASLYPEKPELWLHAGDARAFTDPGKSVRAYARALEANRLAEDERTMLYSHYWWSTPGRPPSSEFPQRLAEIDARLGPTPEVAFRRALMYAEIGGFADAVAQMDRAVGLSPGDVQLELFRAVFLDMEAARANSGEARRAAEAAWQKLPSLQAAAPGGKRIADYTLNRVRSRRDAIRKAAVGP